MTDNKNTINCPACDTEMTKILIPDNGINIDICLNGCGGILFDNRELDKFDERDENIDEILKAVEDKTFKKVEDSEVRICPICNVPMVKMGSEKGGVIIDVCNTCGAKFLDNGELNKIREAGNTNDTRTDALLDIAYQENMKEVFGDKIPEKMKSSPRRQFFENLVNRFLTR